MVSILTPLPNLLASNGSVDILEHWEVRWLKFVSKILRGKFTHRPRNDPSLYDGSYPFIQTGEVARANKYITSYRQTLNDKGYAVSKEFPKGTLTMTIAANIGDVAILDFDACFPDSIVGFVPDKCIALEFLYRICSVMKTEFLKEAPINTQGNLNIDRIGTMAISLPPLGEQQAILAHIEKQTAAIDAAVARVEREIELIGEYRTRLIADVVTGQVDVRHIEVPEGDCSTENAESTEADAEIIDEEPALEEAELSP